MDTTIVDSIERDMLYAVACGEFGQRKSERIEAAGGYVLPAEEEALNRLVRRGLVVRGDPLGLSRQGRELCEQLDIAAAERARGGDDQ